jgi:hypothetical protein
MGPLAKAFGVRRSIFGVSLFSLRYFVLVPTSHQSLLTVVRSPVARSHPFGSHSSIGLEVRDFLKQAVFAEFIVQR